MSFAAIAIIGVSIALQVVAAVMALLLIRITGWRAAWSTIAVAMGIMAGRRAISAAHMIFQDRPIDLGPEILALVISVLMVIGVRRISTSLKEWGTARERDKILRRAQEAFIATSDPVHAGAFQRLADDVHRLSDWDGAIIGLIESSSSSPLPLPVPLGVGGRGFHPNCREIRDILDACWNAVAQQAVPASTFIQLHDDTIAVFPVLAGSEVIGLLILVRDRAKRSLPRTDGMEAIAIAIGNMMGAMRLQHQRAQADQDQKRLIAELERSNRELEQFAYISSHDMQEPLRMVILYLELLQRRYGETLDVQAKEYVGFAVEGAQRMHAMILDLLQYCRLGREEDVSPPEADSSAAVQEAAKQLGLYAFDLRVQSPLPRVTADQTELCRVFQNLLGNAIKFAAKERPAVIAVDAAQEGGHWHFRVRDNGIGIDPAYFDKIFQVFQRLHSRSEYEGTGIGLAFVKKAVENRGGRVWVESEVGAGSTFHFTLPAASVRA